MVVKRFRLGKLLNKDRTRSFLCWLSVSYVFSLMTSLAEESSDTVGKNKAGTLIGLHF
jgi:hypothetical protein